LDKGRSLLIIPGGEAEQIRTENGKELVYVQKRKGFIKLALRKNVPVVPVYVFGVSDMYHTSHAIFGLREWLVKNLGVAVCLTAGKWGSPLCPINVKTTIVFGKPIEMECKEPGEPTDEEVQEKHKEFVTALEKLFNDNKMALGYGDRTLEII
jgi:1-acyl-sn-glycerol-3-phosphate acyltransferase